jgi:hypothetical protein
VARDRRGARGEPNDGREHAGARRAGPGFLAQVAILAAVFAVVSALAELLGAANLGTALGIGQIAFAIALVAVLLWPWGGRRPPREGPPRPR